MVDINPYQILNIPTTATLEEVKEAYRQLATKHHPDKGGNPETFKIVKAAFKMIVDNIKKGIKIQQNTSSSFQEMRDASKNGNTPTTYSPQEFFGKSTPFDPNQNFERDAFNQKFVQNIKDSDETLVNRVGDDYRENRTKEQLLSEQQSIENELSHIKPIFLGKGSFNGNVFNRLFEQVNGAPSDRKDVQEYVEPIALTSGLQPYTEIDEDQKTKQTDKLSTLCYGDLSQCFGQKNPHRFDNKTIESMSKQPDITDVSTLETDYHTKIAKRVSDYQSVKLDFHPKPENTTQLPEGIKSTNPTCDKISQQGLNDAYNRKLQERNGLMTEIKYGKTNQIQNHQQPLQTHQQPLHNHQQPLQNMQQPFMSMQNMPFMTQPNQPLNQYQPQPQPQPQLLNTHRNPAQIHQPMPVMDYPRNSNGNMNDSNQNIDFFAKSPNYFTHMTQPMMNDNNHSNLELQHQINQLQRTVQKQKKVIKMLTPKK